MIEQASPIRKTVLSNGLTIVTEQMNHVRSASFGIWVRSGSRHEDAAINGISHFIEHTLFKGTSTRTSREIAVESDAIGGHVDAFTSREVAAYYVKVLDEHAQRAFDLLADSIENRSELPPSQCIPRGGSIASTPAQAGHCASLFAP